MKNKIILKKYLLLLLVITSLCFILLLCIQTIFYQKYQREFNYKINNLALYLKEKEPGISDKEIIELINNNNYDKSILDKYNIDLDNDYIMDINKKHYINYLTIFVIVYVLLVLGIFIIVIRYDKRHEREINKIIKYINNIINKNYTTEIDHISEDELSILKNEIYKVMIMLKENADNANKDKRELKASLEDISHQLKTPLTSMLIIIDNLLDNPGMDNETRQDFIIDLKREMTNMNFLVQSLLKLSKFDTNTIIYNQSNNSIKDILDEVMDNVSFLADLKNIDILITGKTSYKLFCDKRWEVEALTNIVKNSIEYSLNSNKIDIKISTNKVYTQIDIINYGSEINKNDLKHIFERFYKGHNASKESFGIGLALAKTIIEKDNGSINCESYNKKTKFIIKYYKGM